MSSYHPLQPLVPRDYPQVVTSLSFDPVSDALWAGHASGTVCMYHGLIRVQGVSFVVGRGTPVQKLLLSDNTVTACSSSGIGVWGKGGANKWYHQASQGITTFAEHPSKPHTLVASQPNFQLLVLNSMTGLVTRTVSVPVLLTPLRSSHSLLLAGGPDGKLRTFDLRTTMREHEATDSILAHVGGIQGLEVCGNYAVTIGWAMRQSRPHPDPLVKVFDLRALKPLPPVQFSAGPSFINAHPRSTSTVMIASSQGLVHTIDISKPGSGGEFSQVDSNSFISAAAVSPNGAYLAFGDAEGSINLLTSTSTDDHVPFNGFDGKRVEWADVPARLPEISWDDHTPLNSIGMPYYEAELLSSFKPPLLPASMAMPPPPKIPPQVLNAVKVQDFLQYAILPKELRGKRNVVEVNPQKPDEGRFKSEQSKRIDESPTPASFAFPEIPKAYRKVNIQYSKFGVEDFDFASYNQTSLSGLETDIPNSYSNALIQLLHYSLPIRRLAKTHITTSCRLEYCLLCEFGFVVRMLEDAQGINLQARNFCITIGRKQTAHSFGLIDRSTEGQIVDYSRMIQQLNRFVLEEFAVEENTLPGNPQLIPSRSQQGSGSALPLITQVVGVDAPTLTSCAHCGQQREKESVSHVIDLLYPRKVDKYLTYLPEFTFGGIVRSSLERDITYKSNCQYCKHLANHRSRRALHPDHLPPILALNAAVNNDENHSFWLKKKSQIFLSPEVELQAPDNSSNASLGEQNIKYTLRGYIAEIRMGTSSHLVALVRTGEMESSSSWYIFNDFNVQNIAEAEALSFDGKWKMPCVIFLERQDLIDTLDYSLLPEKIDPAILGQTLSMAAQMDWSAAKQEVLEPHELPTPGTIIAIDAEFVALQQEESELRSDGTKKVLKPSQMSLARVSVLRGSGPKEGVPFMDDYIYTNDVIIDYLTEYSGIQPGDLHPNFSRQVLLPLKVVYKKLRVLVDMGCIFIGHGLSKDFRIINIFVPPERVIDTVDVYFIKERHRRLSLRFLSYYVLKAQIQIDTHDSIEDARAALLLYNKFREHEDSGTFDDLLREIYSEGKKLVRPLSPTHTLQVSHSLVLELESSRASTRNTRCTTPANAPC
ncbi:ubiquitin carboxyl-terminal hydrolase-domain-containing protein [Cantharellus anzutake]|uniref:ubiquitin carboxyl-terminal hydrolase-domain-containing protein n=1 Tax=Cantharellus anzutake TaxID=1750568 RepID=UPI0019036D77|nr:ubiquitin carboxyl-terminal hydrolase-domain-containing protein [Cantharellus anzutake]KAF8333955.1 ubiquitin carboxyl-terminal hydrolase-domain-containing protein [Cantharellus anzutake]